MGLLSPVYLNGELLPAAEARVPVTDQGLLLGLGAFETLRAYQGRPFRLRAHLNRLSATLRWLGIHLPESAEDFAGAVTEVARRASAAAKPGEPAAPRLRTAAPGASPPPAADLRLRITVTAGSAQGSRPAGSLGPTRLITAQPIEASGQAAAPGTRGVSALRLRCPRGLGPVSGKKVTSFAAYVWARRWAEAQGADEALLVDPDGHLVEGAFSNVFVVSGGRVMTPSLARGALPGITRQVVLDLVPRLGLEGGETEIRSEELDSVDEVFCTASVAEVVPVVAVDGVPVGTGAPGPVTKRIWRAYRDLALGETRTRTGS